MSKTPFRAAPRPHGRRRATTPTRSALARAASKSGITASDRFSHRGAVVALTLGLLAVAGGGAAATANSADIARASETTPTQTASASEPSLLAQAASEARSGAAQSPEDKAAADKAAADQAAAAQAASDKAAADQAAAAKAAADKAAADAAAQATAQKAAADAAAAQATPPKAVNDPAAAQAYAASRLGAYGWGQDQMSALLTLWTKESGWSTTATNASSGAYGIVQALPGTKMASVGADWQTNYKTQIEWGLNYIKERYGSPAGALGWHLAHNWY